MAREPGAGWTRKGGRSHFGYRLHVGADYGSNLIRKVAWTPARINESLVAEALMSGDEAAVYADKGYENKHRRARLKAAKIKDRICHRSHKHQRELPHWQSVRNAAIAKRRAPVEQIFGMMKRGFGFVRARYTNFAANVADAFRFATAFNLCRAVSLLAAAQQKARLNSAKPAPNANAAPPTAPTTGANPNAHAPTRPKPPHFAGVSKGRRWSRSDRMRGYRAGS